MGLIALKDPKNFIYLKWQRIYFGRKKGVLTVQNKNEWKMGSYDTQMKAKDWHCGR